MPSTEISLAEVGVLIGGRPWRLRFPQKIEARYEADVGDDRCRSIIRQNCVGIVIYNAFMLGDWLLVRDIFLESVILHLAVMTPIMGLVNYIVGRRPAAWLREGVLALGIMLGTCAILALMLLSSSQLRNSEHTSVVLVILFATMVQRIRFRFVLATCLGSLALYIAALTCIAETVPERQIMAGAVFAGVILFALIGSYNLEHEHRTAYLLGLRERLRNKELEAISCRDALTGMGNRRALDQAIERGRTSGVLGCTRPTAVMLFDVDFFKAYNDANGHLAGDACLKRVGLLIAEHLRLGPENVFRFGGEEFLVLLENTSRAKAIDIGEQIRAGIEAAAISREALSQSVVTVSVGVAAACVSPERTIEALIEDADRALYLAKRSGRNQVQAQPDWFAETEQQAA